MNLPETDERVKELERKVKLLTENFESLLRAFNLHSHYPDDHKNDTFVLLKEAQKP